MTKHTMNENNETDVDAAVAEGEHQNEVLTRVVVAAIEESEKEEEKKKEGSSSKENNRDGDSGLPPLFAAIALEETAYKCHFCEESFDSSGHIEKRCCAKNKFGFWANYDGNIDDLPSFDEMKEFKCMACGEKFGSSQELIRHIEELPF